MATENYTPWSVDISAFDSYWNASKQARFLLNFLVLAPSGHNTQPWKAVVSSSEIRIEPDFRRALGHGDPNHRQLYMSLGCAAENVRVAADYFGMEPKLHVDVDANQMHAVVIAFRPSRGVSSDAQHLIFSSLTRHTNRLAYAKTPISDELRAYIKSQGNDDIHIDIIDASVKKEKMANIVMDALVAAMDDGAFRAELSQYIESNITKSKTGMPMSLFGMPTPLSLVARTIIRRWNINRLSRAQDEAILSKHTPHFVIVSSRSDDPVTWLTIGRAYERIALAATSRGVATSLQAAPIQVGNFHKDLMRELGTTRRPQMFFRIGYPLYKLPRSPRLAASDISLP